MKGILRSAVVGWAIICVLTLWPAFLPEPVRWAAAKADKPLAEAGVRGEVPWEAQLIEAALAKRNCQFYTATYQGDGRDSRTHTFPAKPVFVLIISVGYFYVLMHNAEKGYNYYAGRAGNYDVTWTEDSVTLSRPNAAPDIANTNGTVYSLFAILNAK